MRALTAVVVLAAVCAGLAHGDLLKGIRHRLSKLERRAKAAAGLRNVADAAPLCGTPDTATVSFTFTSQSVCESYTSMRALGGRVGSSWSNCSAATVCVGFTNAVSGTVAGYPVVGIAMYNIGSGSIAFDSNATMTSVAQGYSNSYLPATPQSASLSFAGDCDNTFGALSVQEYPVSANAVQSFNFASC